MKPSPPKPKAPTRPPRSVQVDDCAVMRKPHPCGSFEWDVTRIGADIGLRCCGCGRRLMLDREAFERGVKHLLAGAPDADAELWNPDSGGDGRERTL